MDLRRTSTALTREHKLSVVSIADVKAQARELSNDEDALIGDYIEAAYDFLAGQNGWLGRSMRRGRSESNRGEDASERNGSERRRPQTQGELLWSQRRTYWRNGPP